MSFVEPSLSRKTKTASSRPVAKNKPQAIWFKTKALFWSTVKNPRLMGLIIAGGLTVALATTAVTYAYFANSLATPESIINRKNTGLIFYDKDGQEFYRTYGAKDTTIIKIEDIDPKLIEATLAIEDRDFYKHPGFSIQSIVRSVRNNIRLGDSRAYGGSTITQQLVKNALLSQEKSYFRKFQELVLSIEIDRRYSKDQILELYLTSTFYGSNAYGIEEAAQTYFNTSAKKLSLAQAAMLAGLPQAPSAYSPLDGSQELAGQRQRQVLRAMVATQHITQAEMDQAAATTLTYNTNARRDQASQAPHFVQYVINQLTTKYGEDKIYRQGYRVYTTLDIGLQEQAQKTVKSQVTRLASAGANNGALVAIEPSTGNMLSMVGSADYNNDDIGGKFNVAAATTRQPGSATKPFAYLEYFKQGGMPSTILHDKITDFGGGYKPQNADRRTRGDVTIRRALANSLNIPAVEAVQKIGVPSFVDTLKTAGVADINQTNVDRCGLAVVLGCVEMSLVDVTHAYNTLADQGTYRDLTTYTKIIDKNGGQVFPEKSLGLFSGSASAPGQQVFDRGLVYLITSILSDNAARSEVFGSNNALKLSRPAAAKTGTTDEAKDAWAFGYTPDITIGVWVGNTASTPMTSAGATAAAPIWNQVMEYYLKGKPVQNFDRPAAVVELPTCYGQNAIAEEIGQNTYMEVYLRSNQPTNRCQSVPKPTPTPEEESTPTASPTPEPTPEPTLSPTITPTPTPSPIPTIVGPTIVLPTISP